MLLAYRETDGKLDRIAPDGDLSPAIWIDLYRPLPEQAAAVEALGVAVPTLADMEEIEISNRLYRENGCDYMTAVLPGMSTSQAAMAGPVTFILTPERLVTVRHHAPRPFETFPTRADRALAGCGTPPRLLLGLVEEIIARMADLLEGSGRAMDTVARDIHGPTVATDPQVLQQALQEVGRQGELLGRIRLGLLTLERVLSYFGLSASDRGQGGALKVHVKTLMRDIQALEVHGDFLNTRVALITDATLGMINLAQGAAVKSLSVVAAIFLPPTLIASVFGMNFAGMDILDRHWGYPAALGMMLLSGVATYLFFKWRRWL